MKSLQNAAYEVFVRGCGVERTAGYSAFENVVSSVDKLGKDLLTSDHNPFACYNLTPQERIEATKRNIRYVISDLVALAVQQNIDMKEVLVEAVEASLKHNNPPQPTVLDVKKQTVVKPP
jgi:hypothetical protein